MFSVNVLLYYSYNAPNPQLPIQGTLSKYSHDHDLAVTLDTIFVGLVGLACFTDHLAALPH
jgi:26S proteasome regulatory subunit N1